MGKGITVGRRRKRKRHVKGKEIKRKIVKAAIGRQKQ